MIRSVLINSSTGRIIYLTSSVGKRKMRFVTVFRNGSSRPFIGLLASKPIWITLVQFRRVKGAIVKYGVFNMLKVGLPSINWRNFTSKNVRFGGFKMCFFAFRKSTIRRSSKDVWSLSTWLSKYPRRWAKRNLFIFRDIEDVRRISAVWNRSIRLDATVFLFIN